MAADAMATDTDSDSDDGAPALSTSLGEAADMAAVQGTAALGAAIATAREVDDGTPWLSLDGANIGFAHGPVVPGGGGRSRFSAPGILLAYGWFARRGLGSRVKAFLPAGLGRRHAELQPLLDVGALVLVPSPEDDDTWILTYAVANGGFVVSNDRFRDHTERLGDDSLPRFLAARQLTYAFAGNEFMPSPATALALTSRGWNLQEMDVG